MKFTPALKIALPLVQGKVKHRHYPHVVEMANKILRPLATGKDADHLIHRFNRRENEQEHLQRVRLTELITPAVFNTIMGPAMKVPRVKPVVNTATYGPTEKAKNDKLEVAVQNFQGGKSVDFYIGNTLLPAGAIDPNAFCVTLFDNFDEKYETAKPYPTIIWSEDAWNYEYANGELLWLLVHRSIKYETRTSGKPPKTKGGKKPLTGKADETVTLLDGHAFWWYDSQHQIYFRQIDPATVPLAKEGLITDKQGAVVKNAEGVALGALDTYFYQVNKEELYEVSFYDHKAGRVQAVRLGFTPDVTTGGETMASFVQPAMPFLMKLVKAGSELDLSAALHAFLQRISKMPRCPGYKSPNGNHIDCVDGYQPDGKTVCKNCNGQKYIDHGSGQDHVLLALERPGTENPVDIEKMVHYVPLPVEVLQWQDGYVDKLQRAAYQARYGSTRLITADATNTTATGDLIDLQGIYDALKLLADWFSTTHNTEYKLIASFVVGSDSVKDLKVAHEFPRNMRFETLGERVILLKSLRDAGASTQSLAQVEDDIEADLYVDDPEAAKKARVQSKLTPFRGKSEATIVTLISQDLAEQEDKVFWTNSAKVFALCEQRAAEQKGEDNLPVNFYDMSEDAQREMAYEIVKEIMDTIQEQVDAMGEKALEMAMDQASADGSVHDANTDTGRGAPASPGDTATK